MNLFVRTTLLLLVVVSSCSAQRITNIVWTTRFASPPPALDARLLAGVQLAVKLGEDRTIGFSSLGARALGLNEAESRKLVRLLSLRYQELRTNSLFRTCPSQLAYCYSVDKPKIGRANVYLPSKPDTNLHPIVFLHGYGGSFKWYLHALARACPKRVIIAPAYGIHPLAIPGRYLLEAVKEAKRGLPELKDLPKPVLVGLSAGGRGACQLYAARPGDFIGLVCVAALPPRATWQRFGGRHRLQFIDGAEEPHVKNGQLGEALKSIRRRSKQVGSESVEAGDHYFLLEFPRKSEMLIARAVAAIAGRR